MKSIKSFKSIMSIARKLVFQRKWTRRMVLFSTCFSVWLVALSAQAQFGIATFWKRHTPKLAFATAAQNTYTSLCSSPLTIQTKNGLGVVSNVASNLTVNLASSGSVTFYSDSTCTQTITSTTVTSGTNSVSIYFIASSGGTPEITASATAYTSAAQSETISNNPFVWTGGGANADWSTAANWSGGATPGAANVAVFDGTCVTNCSPSISSNASIAGVRITSGYSGTITQNAGVTVTVGSNWVQQSGTFVGGNSAITISGLLYIMGGSFTSTSGTLSVASDISSGSVVTVLKIANGVIFNAGGGTIEEKGNYYMYSTGILNLDIDSSVMLNNLTINPSQCGSWWYLTGNYGADSHAAVNPIQISGTLNHACGRLSGIYKVSGNIILGAGAGGGTDTARVEMMGAGTQTYSYAAGGTGALLKINKASGVVQAAVGTTDLKVNSLYLTQGIFTAPSGTLTLTRLNGFTSDLFQKLSGTTFSHNNGTVAFAGYLANCAWGSFDFNINASDDLQFNNVDFAGNLDGCYGNRSKFQQPGAGTITILGTTNMVGGSLYGSKWVLQGSLALSSSNFAGGTAALAFAGGNTQNITVTAGTFPTGTVTVNKSGGSIVQQSNVSWAGASQALTNTAGTWNMNGYNLNVAGALTNSGSLTKGANPSCGALTYGSFSGNAATCP